MSLELTPILIAVATVGVALAALMVGLFAWLRQDMGGRIDRLESRTNEKFDQVSARITGRERDHQERFVSLDRGQAELRERMAKLEGLLEGLREAVTGHRAAS